MQYEIIGNNMQAVRITLGAGEKIFTDSGKLVSKSSNMKMQPRLVGGIIGAIERKATGATGMLTEFEAQGAPGNVSVSGILPGKIYVIKLNQGEQFIAEHDAFLAAESTVKFTIATVSIGAAFFGGAGLILQKFDGPGTVFLHIVGDVIEYNLDGTTPLEIDPGHVAGFDVSLKYKITFVDNIKTMMFGGVGMFLAEFTGKGKVVAHSVSKLKLSSEIYLDGRSQVPSNER
ncbi:MAG: TIGR00266 family protein [Candidatus Marsarchaeota archaeon]|nr:TIGR00266 family protein [Candidatus Marsarchaeota archaeon]MCL5418778.1 TIGR00266 family protein [Candidatus Marsarchaeota archaeon]